MRSPGTGLICEHYNMRVQVHRKMSKKEAGENPAQSRYCIQPSIQIICHWGPFREGDLQSFQKQAVSQDICLYILLLAGTPDSADFRSVDLNAAFPSIRALQKAGHHFACYQSFCGALVFCFAVK